MFTIFILVPIKIDEDFSRNLVNLLHLVVLFLNFVFFSRDALFFPLSVKIFLPKI